MVDFVTLIGCKRIPAVPERFRVPAKRIDCNNESVKVVTCKFEVQDLSHGKALVMVEGGVTGYESFYLQEYADNTATLDWMGKEDWFACAGTKGRWDQLIIGAEEMSALKAWVLTQLGDK